MSPLARGRPRAAAARGAPTAARICIVDDHPLVLEAVSTVLERRGHEVRTALDLDEARVLLREHPPFDLLVLDHQLRSGKGSELFLTSDLILPPRIVMLSALTDPDDILYVLERTPVVAFVMKQIDLEDLAEAVAQCWGLAPTDVGYLWAPERHCFIDARQAFPAGTFLTPREREVLMLLREGLLDKQIAGRLERSIHTVRVQIRAIRRKRGHSRRAETDV